MTKMVLRFVRDSAKSGMQTANALLAACDKLERVGFVDGKAHHRGSDELLDQWEKEAMEFFCGNISSARMSRLTGVLVDKLGGL